MTVFLVWENDHENQWVTGVFSSMTAAMASIPNAPWYGVTDQPHTVARGEGWWRTIEMWEVS